MSKENLSEFLKRHGAEEGDAFSYIDRGDPLSFQKIFNRHLRGMYDDRFFEELPLLTVIGKDGHAKKPLYEYKPKEWTVGEVRQKVWLKAPFYLCTIKQQCYDRIAPLPFWASIRTVKTLWRLQEINGEEELVKVDINKLMEE